MSIVILEGVDKTGKTTLGLTLCEKYNLQYVKINAPAGDAYQEYLTKILKHKKPTLFDRFHLGELAYGKVLREKSQLDEVKLRNLELLLKMHDTQVIYCYNSVKFIAEKFKSEHEDKLTTDKIYPVMVEYNHALKRTTLPVFKYKIGDKLPSLKVKQVEDFLLKTRIIGNRTPTVLIVGNVNNTSSLTAVKYMQLPFDFGFSSNYLFKRLLRVDSELKLTAITNSVKAHLKVENQLKLLKEEIKLLKPKVIVTLGQHAKESVKQLKLSQVTLNLPHPAFEGRFKTYNINFDKQLRKAYA